MGGFDILRFPDFPIKASFRQAQRRSNPACAVKHGIASLALAMTGLGASHAPNRNFLLARCVEGRAFPPCTSSLPSHLREPGMSSQYFLTPLMLVCSNVFMTFAWYGHLKYKSSPLILAIVVSWSIALLEYCFAVPANRFGSAVYSTAQLKTIQEVITLTVFAVFSVYYLHQPITWNQVIGFALICAGAFFVFRAPL
jgi:uncharacterized protein (DUF486 family)